MVKKDNSSKEPNLKKSEELAQEESLAHKFANNWQKKKLDRAKKHQFKAFDLINNLVVTKREGKTIEVADGRRMVEFACCSYLGLDVDKRVVNAGKAHLEEYGVNLAVARTRLRMEPFDVLEKLLSQMFCGASISIFTSLHLTHLGFLPLLGSGEMPSFPIKKNGPLFIMDTRAHACLQINQGLLEQFGQVVRTDFREEENIIAAFEQAGKNRQTPISLSDSVVSMGGIVPVLLLLELAEKYDGYIYLDDAHGTSIYGKNGCGYTLDLLKNKFHPRMILTPALSKGFGTNGGILALPTKKDTEIVKRFDSNYLFGNPPPMSIITSSIASAKIHLTDEIDELQKKLWDNVAYFDSLNKSHTNYLDYKAPIRAIFIGDEHKTIECTAQLQEAGFFVTGAMYPTVAMGKSILRVALSALHSKEEIAELCKYINKYSP
ncbi:MAG: 8-amino-7-oxononanoate synthase [Chlamydiae bacterium]|nr:8-amino-7-oxononanoate synthase [Chlamydiota bacterium]